MKAAAVKSLIMALEIMGVLIAAAAALGGYLFWRLESGPLALPFLDEPIVAMMERRLADNRGASVSVVELVKDKSDGGYNIIFRDLRITDETDRPILTLPRAMINLTPDDLFNARLKPRRIILDRPALQLRRSADRRLLIDYPGVRAGPEEGRRASLIDTLQESRLLGENFERAELVDAEFAFYDETTGRRWRANSANAVFSQSLEGFHIEGAISFDDEGRASDLSFEAVLSAQTGAVDVDLTVNDAPLGEIIAMTFAERVDLATSRITGRAKLKVDASGRIRRADLTGRAGPGALQISGAALRLEEARLAAVFNPDVNAFDIAQLAVRSDRIDARIAGLVRIKQNGPQLGSVSFNLIGERATINLPALPQPTALSDIALTGDYDAASGVLAISQFKARAVEAGFAGALSLGFGGRRAAQPGSTERDNKRRSPAISATLEVDRALSGPEILALWPLNIGVGARNFVRDRLIKGRAGDIRASFDAPGGVFAELPDDALQVRFNIANATVVIAPGMTPLRRASGGALLTLSAFRIDEIRARLSDAQIRNGSIHFTALRPRGQDVVYRFDVDGDAGDILTVANQEPLALLARTAVDPAMFSGRVKAAIEIIRPNLRHVPRQNYKFSGRAVFDDLMFTDFFADASLTGAKGVLTLATRSMNIKADAMIGDLPLGIDWRLNFYDGDDASQLTLKGRVGSATADMFGLPTRQFLRGSVDFQARTHGGLGALSTLDIAADFTDSTLLFDPLGWSKPAGEATKGSLRVTFADDRIAISDIDLDGERLRIRGDIAVNRAGRIEAAAFEEFVLADAADFKVQADRTASDALSISLIGSYWDISAPLATALSILQEEDGPGNPAPWGAGLILRSRLDRVDMQNGVRYQDVDIDFWRDADRIQSLDVSARELDGDLTSFNLAHTGALVGAYQSIEVRTDDIGALLSGVFGLRSVKGGQAVLDIGVHAQAGIDDDAPAFDSLRGRADVRRLQIVGAPLLARVFSAGSLSGFSDLLSGEGIYFSSASGQFGFRDGALFIRDLRAKGPSLGFSSEGRIASDDKGGVDLNGAIAPAYQVNSILGRAPLIGDLFINKDGEGVVAFAYSIEGGATAPSVTVNTLSALTPGALRRLFEPDRRPIDALLEEEDGDAFIVPPAPIDEGAPAEQR